MTAHARLESKGTARPTWLGAHPIAGAGVITALTGLGLQLTHLIDFQERISTVTGWTLQLRFADFGFRMTFGVLVLLLILPFLFGHSRHRPWFRDYLRYVLLTSGHTPWLTVTTTVVSASILVALVIGLGGALGVLELDPDFWVQESRWFILILALVPGIWEELAFRGLMLSNLQQRYKPGTAVLVTAVMFGLMHFTNLILREPSQVVFEVIMATTVGIAWGYLAVKTGSVLPAMTLHYVINVLIELTIEPELSETAGAAIFGSITIAYPALTIIAVWWLTRSKAPHQILVAAQSEGADLPVARSALSGYSGPRPTRKEN